ncbi:MAG: hypothetical protein L3J21_02120 [Devosiaceae bacterium]|nr:hypothetical protein [Devosiaceae bacterium]
MKTLRLLPIVLVGATALLLLKSIGLITQGGYTLLGTDVAQAQVVNNQNPDTMPNAGEGQAEQLSAIEEAAAQRAADSLFSSVNQPVRDNGQVDALPTLENEDGEISEFGNADGVSLTEQALLQRLRERRAELDAREQTIELQENLVVAAEARLNERIAYLQAIEAQVQALVDQQQAQDEGQFDALVSMYANMKSSDAANVFNSLNMDVLLRLAIKMSPRKMSPILADMNTERAQQLTVRMATAQNNSVQTQAAIDQVSPDMASLPQIVGQ